jgi:hypothetical protein
MASTGSKWLDGFTGGGDGRHLRNPGPSPGRRPAERGQADPRNPIAGLGCGPAVSKPEPIASPPLDGLELQRKGRLPLRKLLCDDNPDLIGVALDVGWRPRLLGIRTVKHPDSKIRCLRPPVDGGAVTVAATLSDLSRTRGIRVIGEKLPAYDHARCPGGRDESDGGSKQDKQDRQQGHSTRSEQTFHGFSFCSPIIRQRILLICSRGVDPSGGASLGASASFPPQSEELTSWPEELTLRSEEATFPPEERYFRRPKKCLEGRRANLGWGREALFPPKRATGGGKVVLLRATRKNLAGQPRLRGARARSASSRWARWLGTPSGLSWTLLPAWMRPGLSLPCTQTHGR